MKKLIFILLGIAIIVIVGAGCGEGDKKDISIYDINQDVRVGDIKWKLVDVKDRGNILKASESRYSFIAENKTTSGRFIEITIEVENLSKELKSVSNLTLIDSKGREFTSASDVSEWISEEKELFLLDNLNPNMPIQFSDIYEVPIDAKSLKVIVGDLEFWGGEEALINLGL